VEGVGVPRESGFTLFEIIISLVILGIMAAVAGMGIVTGVKGYAFTRENAHLAQKSSLAMARMTRELLEIIDVDVTNVHADALVYRNSRGWTALGKVSQELKLRNGPALPDASNGDVLIDNVAAFNLSYLKDDGSGNEVAWIAGTDDVTLLASIEVDLTLNRTDPDGGTINFHTAVNPRNNGNAGGVPVGTVKFSPWF
jgi:prepilin-type N-terminal cleavage/methylation domain-containing protein